MSTDSLVLAKSKGYTKSSEQVPPNPPDNKVPIAYLSFYVSGSYGQNIYLNLSLKAIVNAIVGNYLHKFVKLPFHKVQNPSYLIVLTKQSTIPL